MGMRNPKDCLSEDPSLSMPFSGDCISSGSKVILFPRRRSENAAFRDDNGLLLRKTRRKVADRFTQAEDKVRELLKKVMNIWVYLGIVDRKNIVRKDGEVFISTEEGLVSLIEYLELHINT